MTLHRQIWSWWPTIEIRSLFLVWETENAQEENLYTRLGWPPTPGNSEFQSCWKFIVVISEILDSSAQNIAWFYHFVTVWIPCSQETPVKEKIIFTISTYVNFNLWWDFDESACSCESPSVFNFHRMTLKKKFPVLTSVLRLKFHFVCFSCRSRRKVVAETFWYLSNWH